MDKRSWTLPLLLLLVLAALIGGGLFYKSQMLQNAPEPTPSAILAESFMGSPSPLPSESGSPLPNASGSVTPAPSADLSVDANGLSKATAVIRLDAGTIKFKFYPVDAPETVKRFVELINQGFYNGLTFHRVVPGFVIQGGDPVGNGTGGSGKNIKAEFNSRKHVEGAVAMARAQDPDSADSQFYITLAPQPRLDHQYTVFGLVVSGMDIVKKVKVGDRILAITIE